MKEMATLAFIGDVMLGQGVNQKIAYRSQELFWGSTLPLLRHRIRRLRTWNVRLQNRPNRGKGLPSWVIQVGSQQRLDL